MRVKTTKNEEITIPNATLLGGGVVNYSTLAEKQGLILPTTITIGYGVPWKQVHQLLKDAALRTEFVEKEQAPFVLQKSLDDWYVAYELNVYTKESHKIAQIYSIPQNYLQRHYQAPSFRVEDVSKKPTEKD